MAFHRGYVDGYRRPWYVKRPGQRAIESIANKKDGNACYFAAFAFGKFLNWLEGRA